MQALYQSLAGSTVGICLLVALANAILALQGIGRSAAVAFVIAFFCTALTWWLGVVLPQDSSNTTYSLLMIHSFGAVGMSALWTGLWLRAGHRPSAWFMGSLILVWLIPILGVLYLGWHGGAHVPFSVLAITAGLLSSVWKLYRKRGRKNAGDWALIIWMLFALPVSAYAMLMGVDTAHSNPAAVWIFYLGFLPTVFTGVGLFTLLSVALDALRDSTELAQTDGLTGLFNRRAFDDELGVAAARAERYRRDLSLIVLDVDNFKQLNDEYGHPAGDAVLRAVAQVLLDKSRRIDTVARIGGEEFALVLADTHVAAALRLAERLRQALCNASTESITFSASFGVASVAETPCSAESLAKAADDALYAAKAAGRNCVRYAKDVSRDPAELIALV